MKRRVDMAAKQEYITIGLPKATLAILKKFMEQKGLTTKEGFNEIAEAYMIARDSDLYHQLQDEYYGIETIREKMSEGNLQGDNEEKEVIVCKLSDTTSTKATGYKSMSGRDTIKAYLNNQNTNGKGFTYYSTSNLHTGMSPQKAKEYTERIDSGEVVKVYFILNDEQTENDIAYSAVLKEIVNSKTRISAPCEEDEYPHEFVGEEATIWLKLEQIQPESNEKASNYIVIKKGTNLKESVSTGQCAFMYVKKITA
jgi:hypothetical protein